jgi:hypothetical protein
MRDKRSMTDQQKFTLVISAATALVALVLSSGLFPGTYLDRVGEYARRRAHYERVISPKGLSQHEGMFWKEKR